MRFEHSQRLRTGQHMRMVPRLIQSMEVLQMPVAELHLVQLSRWHLRWPLKLLSKTPLPLMSPSPLVRLLRVASP